MIYNSSVDSSRIYYTYDGSFDGLLSVIYTAVYSRIIPAGISPEHDLQFSFDCRYINVETDRKKAERVYHAILEKIGSLGCRRLYYVFLSNREEKDIIIYKYMMLGFKNGKITNSAIADDTVCEAVKIAENVSCETEKFRQFTRFSICENGVQYAKIVPNNNILPVLMPFFVKRLGKIPFVLQDFSHNICSVYDTKEWYITSSEGLNPLNASISDREFGAMWKVFFDTIAIKERENPKFQKKMMPSRYFREAWAYNE